VRDLGDLTVGEHLLFKLLGICLLAGVTVPALIHMKNNHRDVWEEVSASPSSRMSSATMLVMLRYAVVMVLVLAIPMGLLVAVFRGTGG
jgi:succinate dehydrogenase hydrophobic anchor subunit